MLEQNNPVISHMTALIDQWEDAQDRRAIFPGCYT